jgi:prepilin-type N-terminal cleavage/methylation domain-containing protein
MKRRGFTLMEMVLVLLILGIIFVMVVPSVTSIGRDPEEGKPWKEIADLLRSSRDLALKNAVTVRLVLDPQSGRYQADTAGARGGGLAYEGELSVGMAMYVEADSARAKFVFRPDGSAFADSLIVRQMGYATKVWVDPYTGEVLIEDR